MSTALTVGEPGHEPEAPLAIVACRHVGTLSLAREWLVRTGFRVAAADSVEAATRLLGTAPPALALVDAALRTAQGASAWTAIRQAPGGGELPLLALCSSDREARLAILEGSTDVMRKPLDWPILSQRALRLASAHRVAQELAQMRSAREREAEARGEPRPGEAAGSLDPLTGLPNRKAYEQVLDDTLGANARSGAALAVMVLDLDRFKLVNESYGRRRGSQILIEVAERLKGSLRGRELVGRRRVGLTTGAIARLGGDAFSIMVSPVAGGEEVRRAADAVLDALSAPFVLEDTEAYVSASLGVALAPADGASAEELVQHAELAMAEARRRGDGSCRFYSRELTDVRERALKIDRRLRRAFERDELRLHYQPLVETRSRRIVGAEALLRWTDGELGVVEPLEFIPVAEETGFMLEIGRWVLKTACRQLRAWLDDGAPAIRIATNVSLCQLLRGDLAQAVDEALAESGIDPGLLELELSERGALHGDPDVLRQLQLVRARGVRLSVDDFGTGDSAIAYLKKFPLDTLKIDRSFVAGASSNDDDAAIASAMIAMAHRLRLRVVAEGVEKPQELELLRELECEELQGFLFSPGVPAAEFRALLAGEPPAGGGEGWRIA
jgi:diguanylate cyclase (GGDEF)-like protein